MNTPTRYFKSSGADKMSNMKHSTHVHTNTKTVACGVILDDEDASIEFHHMEANGIQNDRT